MGSLLYKIHNEDCKKTLLNVPDEYIDLIITSPPYDNLRTYNGIEWNFDIFKEIAKELFRVMKKGGVIVWIVNDATKDGSETLTSFKQAIYFKEECKFNIHDTMIWQRSTIPQTSRRYEPQFEYMFIISKGSPKTFNPIKIPKIYKDNRKLKKAHRNTNGEYYFGSTSKSELKNDYNVWYIPVGGYTTTKDTEAYKHPAIFPELLVKKHIISWSNELDIIYDPFSGSGTTCKVADKLNRKWFGSEIVKEYCDIANDRISKDMFSKLNYNY